MITPEIGKWYSLNKHNKSFIFVEKFGLSNWGQRALSGLHLFKTTDTKTSWTVIDLSAEDIEYNHIENMTSYRMRRCIKMIFGIKIEVRD